MHHDQDYGQATFYLKFPAARFGKSQAAANPSNPSTLQGLKAKTEPVNALMIPQQTARAVTEFRADYSPTQSRN